MTTPALARPSMPVSLTDLAPISLADLSAQAELLTRVDRKYVVPTSVLPLWLERVAAGTRILEIDGRRNFAYRSCYWDTDQLDSFLTSGQGRRRRFKVRSRTYLDTGSTFLEVKTRGPRGTTVKERVLHPDVTGRRGDVHPRRAVLRAVLLEERRAVDPVRIPLERHRPTGDVRQRTIGGVIHPGDPLVDIVPLGDELILEARVSPNDIDDVGVGQAAIVHLTAYRQRHLPRIDGVVTSVSADRMLDQRTNEPYFAAKVKVDPKELEHLDQHVVLTPGMPAEVMIVTKERTMLDYLLAPLTDTFRRGMRED